MSLINTIVLPRARSHSRHWDTAVSKIPSLVELIFDPRVYHNAQACVYWGIRVHVQRWVCGGCQEGQGPEALIAGPPGLLWVLGLGWEPLGGWGCVPRPGDVMWTLLWGGSHVGIAWCPVALPPLVSLSRRTPATRVMLLTPRQQEW